MSSEQSFRLVLTATARRQLTQQLPEAVAFAALALINGPLLANPHRVGNRLMPPLDDRHSARRGTYRILYRINDNGRIVTGLAVAPRADAYRPQ